MVQHVVIRGKKSGSEKPIMITDEGRLEVVVTTEATPVETSIVGATNIDYHYFASAGSSTFEATGVTVKLHSVLCHTVGETSPNFDVKNGAGTAICNIQTADQSDRQFDMYGVELDGLIVTASGEMTVTVIYSIVT